MKEKLLQFFTGKMGKAVYISIASAVVCGAVVITATVIVHNNNKKIDSVLESLTATESVAELSSENATESVSNMGNTDLDTQVKAPNGEPAGDKALQYLAEYDKLTKEYERKRAELENKIKPLVLLEDVAGIPKIPVDDDSENQVEWEKEYASKVAEIESRNADKQKQNEIIEKNNADIQKQLSTLDTKYEKDIATLKSKYGIV